MNEDNTPPHDSSAPSGRLHQPCSALSESPLDSFTGFKFEHILISVVVVHNREIGQFDDTCAGHIERGLKDYQGVLMVEARAQYKHCTEEQHVEGCDCGLCAQVRQNERGLATAPDDSEPS